MVGGFSATGKQSLVGRFDLTTRQWTEAGDLVTPRQGHNVIYDGNYLLVIGGDGNKMSEKCSIENGQVECTSQVPDLFYYRGVPLLFPLSNVQKNGRCPLLFPKWEQ